MFGKLRQLNLKKNKWILAWYSRMPIHLHSIFNVKGDITFFLNKSKYRLCYQQKIWNRKYLINSNKYFVQELYCIISIRRQPVDVPPTVRRMVYAH